MLIDQGPIGLEIHSPTNTPKLIYIVFNPAHISARGWNPKCVPDRPRDTTDRYASCRDQIRIEQLAEHFHIAVG